MNDPKAHRLARLERICLVGALAALFVGAAWKSGAGDGIIMGRYQATPPTLADGAPMDMLMGPRAELIVGTSASSSVRVQGTTEDGVAPLTSEDAPVLGGGVDAGGLAQTQAMAADGRALGDANLQIGNADAPGGAGAVTASTPRTTLASDDPAVTALQVIDDWDEANRAAVNAIAGQVGVQGGAGAATALTLRTTQATDDLVPLATTTDGGAASTRAMTVAGFDGANAQQLLTATSGALRVDPTGTTAQPITDAAGSLTVDAPVGTPVFTRLSDGAAAQGTVANPLFTRVSDGADSNLVTAAGELNVIATAQPGVDLGDVTLTASAANIGDVDVLTLPGALTGLAEDAAHLTGDVGVEALAVHSDTAQTLAGANGDYAPAVLTRLGAHRTAAQPEAYIDSLGAYYLVSTAFTTVTTAGAAEIQPVAAQGAGNSIVLIDWIVSTDTAINVQFESDDSDAGITARIYLAANGGWTSDHAAAWGETADNQALKLQVSAAATVSVQVRYFVR